MSKFTIDPIENETALVDQMTEPIPEVADAVSGIDGEVMILGIAGKMGLTRANFWCVPAQGRHRGLAVFQSG